MAYAVELSPSAERQIRKLESQLQLRVIEELEGLGKEPRPPGVTKVKGMHGVYRVRVGDYRVIYEIHDDILVVLVLKVRHRREAYRRQ